MPNIALHLTAFTAGALKSPPRPAAAPAAGELGREKPSEKQVPIFKIKEKQLTRVEQKNFALEKDLQSLVEENIDTVFNCRFVATEFSTGTVHAGRIDSLALSEENNPVIIEYKKVESSDLINQSLFYLHWIQDHKGDFEVAAQNHLGADVKVDWSDVRVICIAPNYKKYDLHAVQVMGANIELWKYRLYANSSLYLEEVFGGSPATVATDQGVGKNPVMVAAGKKAAQVRTTASYTYEEHLQNKSPAIQDLMQELRDYVVGLDSAIEEVPKKLYVAYKASQNIVCVEPQKKHIKLFLKLRPKDVVNPPASYRDVSNIGHFGTGDVEFTISTSGEFQELKEFIELAYNKVGG
jgi:predicted transport protein